MKPEWREFLTHAGVELEGGRVVSFGNPEREKRVVTTGDVLCDLSHEGLICAYGDDATKFLQSQLSSDVAQVSEYQSQLSAYCNPKGRMLAAFRVFQRAGTYYLRLPREMLEPTLKRLKMFVLMSKVTLEDASDSLVHVGYSGPGAVKELETALDKAPAQVNDCLTTNGCTVIRIQGPHPRFEIYGELEAMKALWDKLNVRGAPVGASPWALLDIMAGIPTIFPATSEAFVPQMANMDLIDGVSFSKGCYPGQEVVARMHYLGKLKRRMYRVRLDTDALPHAGDEVFAEGDQRAEAKGQIVDAQPHPDGGVAALAVLRIENAEHDELRLANAGAALEIRDLPYSLNAETGQP
ncbi:MAG: YgfZ/GcvT domain-containing protein [Gammaproteobacteria bacterium]